LRERFPAREAMRVRGYRPWQRPFKRQEPDQNSGVVSNG
jgi:hypothetical protein